MFRDENAFASSSNPRPRGGARKLLQDTLSSGAEEQGSRRKSPSSTAAVSSVVGRPRPLGISSTPTLVRSLTPSLEVRAINAFMQQRVNPSNTPPINILDYLHHFRHEWNSSNSESPLNLAIKAVSLVEYGRTQRDATAFSESRKMYRHALVATSSAIDKQIPDVSDQLLLKVMAMA